LAIAERIKTITAYSHQTLEKSIVSLIRELETAQDYIDLLSLFYSYFGGVEGLMAEYNLVNDLPDYYERRKAVIISEDILALGGKIPQICEPPYLPRITGRFQALGALYVLEGSTLGGVHIVKMIRNKLPQTENAFSFFSAYGNQTLTMWHKFKYKLDRCTEIENDIALILSGAEDTFNKFEKWIKTDHEAG
jgi:heme oxygenase (biliverdin-IX-beta and delta-forming)